MKSNKARIEYLAGQAGLDLMIQSNMPGYRFTVILTDAIKPGFAGSTLFYGGTADTLAFLQGYGAGKYYNALRLPAYPINGHCPECNTQSLTNKRAFDAGDSCPGCGWRPACPLCDTEI